MVQEYKYLTPEQIDFFMENGYVVIKNAFSREKSAEWTKDMWTRLGYDPNDKSTWPKDKDRINMPSHNREDVSYFAPKAWGAMLELLGGEDRIAERSGWWGDSFIVNLGSDEIERQKEPVDPKDLDNWHVDGDSFVHFLDSPEQGLLVTPIFSDIKSRGGGTCICPEGITIIAKYLAAHPEGVLPTPRLCFTPSTSTYADPKDDPHFWSHAEEVKKCNNFVEATGEVGDVILLHPFMLHSASKNYLRIPRVITNPRISLKEPFNFNRENPDDYSLVEKKTLKALGVDRLDFKITTERRSIVPLRVQIQQKMLEEEKQRLADSAKASVAPNVITMAPTPISVV
ncbi:hypothetical protein SERLA73DRAFT_161227 [Serpula lacrymans var. lacrymans S7.3]|uniref:Phytanoyl-CoA dioxygenase n=2 Tax=Serpula lacrymans var. lacrymans TaxID=341189 RepID=F8Q012_SERL3|nr:uncharacterized protein SERLADRAFT_439364 [Serpula lacrymans var. lacrymans S7.9]EGN98484.1 hypothetical protein SERLA73DRAFT_161227 [Serpula lacrymans var. lacrymans S7.3]EGO24061.1 hypothetical protein SERLADRAFT_439364 [Serpula lacrymans var. lacrymans S7.9]